MRQRVHAWRFLRRGVISLAGVIASLALAPPAHAESRRHDGFYAAANAGVGYLKTSSDKKRSDWNGSDWESVSIPLSLWSGSTFGPVALGGGLTTDFLLYCVALFADIYPDPNGGFHVMPSLGWGFFFPIPTPPRGPVLGGGVGYDFWVASEVSMGVMARFTYAPLHDGSASYTTYEPALLYTVTYH